MPRIRGRKPGEHDRRAEGQRRRWAARRAVNGGNGAADHQPQSPPLPQPRINVSVPRSADPQITIYPSGEMTVSVSVSADITITDNRGKRTLVNVVNRAAAEALIRAAQQQQRDQRQAHSADDRAVPNDKSGLSDEQAGTVDG